jgi:CRP-like cAMP-binding protein
MPKTFQYKSGALIYCRGDEANKICILQSGKLSLVLTDLETGADIRNPVQPGEFFGVKSALGRFPREENAIALADSTIMSFSVPEFESLVMANTRIILKMLKVFSNQMRRTHAQVANLTETNEMKPDEGLFAIGEKYLKNRNFAHAKYVFSRYLTLYPTGKDAEDARKNLKFAESGSTGPAVRKQKNPEPAENDTPPPITDEDTPLPSQAEDAPPPPPASDPAIENAYYDAVNLISQQQYQEALQVFNQIVAANENPEWAEKSAYEAGHCLFLLKEFDECIKYYTQFLDQHKEYPDARDVMFYIGQSYEKMNSRNQASEWYKKIIALSGEEKDAARTKAMKALKALE